MRRAHCDAEPVQMDSVYKPASRRRLYLDDAAWETAVTASVVQFNAAATATGPGVLDAGGRIGRNFAPERQQESISLFGACGPY